MFKVLVAIISFYVVLSASSLNTAQKYELLECYKEYKKTHIYMYEETRWYSKRADCYSNTLDLSDRLRGDIKVFEYLSKESFELSKTNPQDRYMNINPRFIKWISENIIITDASSSWFKPIYELYHKEYASEMRNIFRAYHYLVNLKDYSKEIKKYKQHYENGEKMIRYILKTYQDEVTRLYHNESLYDIDQSMFWVGSLLRKGLGESSNEIQELILKIANGYDKKWFKELQKLKVVPVSAFKEDSQKVAIILNEKGKIGWQYYDGSYILASLYGDVESMLKVANFYKNFDSKYALKWYKKAADLRYKEVYYPLAEFYMYNKEFKDIEKALGYYELCANDNNTECMNGLSWYLIDNDVDIVKGLQIAEKMVTLSPDNRGYLDTLAWGYYKANDCFNAYKAMKSAIELYGNNANKVIQNHWNLIQECK